MRRVLLTSVAVSAVLAIGLAEAALAADMSPAPAPVYVKAPLPPVWSWTGFYLGGNAGYSWGTSNSNVSFVDGSGSLLATTSGSFAMNGPIGGGQVGYNWQTGNWVLGLEADIQASGQQGTATFACGSACGVPTFLTVNEKLDWFGTARGRLGYTVTPTVLLYGTGGLAYGNIETNGDGDLKTGWTAGGGIEARIVGNWTAKLEYLYMDFGDPGQNPIQVLQVCAPVAACTGIKLPISASSTSSVTDNIVRLGVNYKFN
jgi:outer membrane immunogenic protein